MGFSVKYNEKRNKWIWRARVTINSKQYEKSGSADKQQDAELEGSQVYAKLVKEKNSDFVAIDRNITLEELMREWFKTYKEDKLSVNTLISYKGCMENHILPNLGFIPVTKLNRLMYQKFINSLINQDYAINTVKLIHSVVNNCMSFALHDLRLIEYNPTEKIKIQAKKKKGLVTENHMYYSNEELDKLYTTAKATEKAVIADLILFLPRTGLRIGEALGLTVEDYHEDNGTLTINKQLLNRSTHSNIIFSGLKTVTSNRTIYVDSETEKIIKRRILDNKKSKLKHPEIKCDYNFLFSHLNKPIRHSLLRDTLARVSSRAGVVNYRGRSVHAFRHTHVKNLVEAGVPEITIQQRVGHSKESAVTKRYMHSDEAMDKLAIEQYENFMAQQH
ncbi:site-specific integrase [Listeria sp. SHR_NRA_18]|uniref:tyrosine-type recombinase/integrase n=1 Tax=Listeria sp. SHR_NRA_18 TaxID=2269046 RepID=UPI001374AF7B|nr:site-specific integrase [Listeria sp. SHR_NRA_18]